MFKDYGTNIISVDKIIFVLISQISKSRKANATNGIVLTVEETKNTITLQMEGVIYSEGFNRETFLKTLETLNECVEKTQELLAR